MIEKSLEDSVTNAVFLRLAAKGYAKNIDPAKPVLMFIPVDTTQEEKTVMYNLDDVNYESILVGYNLLEAGKIMGAIVSIRQNDGKDVHKGYSRIENDLIGGRLKADHIKSILDFVHKTQSALSARPQ